MRQIDRECVMALSTRLEEIATARRSLLLQLEELQLQLDDLDAQERTVKIEQNMLYNRDAPTANLPDELLAVVFEAGMSQAQFGVLVSHVSSRWRSIALATPMLWVDVECLCVLPPNDDEASIDDGSGEPPAWLKRASIYLSRSRSSPVNIHIYGTSSEYAYAEDRQDWKEYLPHDFVSLIRNHIGHCRELLIDGIADNESLQMLLESFAYQSAPLLSSFSFITGEQLDFQWRLAAPRLENVNLQGSFGEQQLRATLPSFGAITSLRLAHLHVIGQEAYNSLRDALMALKTISRLELQPIGLFQPPSALPITLPSLQFLGADCRFCPADMNCIIKTIHATSLISLSLSSWDNAHDGSEPTWSAPHEHRELSLRHLLISGGFSPAFSEFKWFSRKYPNIDRLTCWGADVNLMLAAIAAGDGGNERGSGPGDGPRWSKLRSIGARNPAKPLDLVVLRNAILKLQEGGRPFGTLSLPQPDIAHLDANAMAELRGIINIGDFSDDWPMPFNFWSMDEG